MGLYATVYKIISMRDTLVVNLYFYIANVAEKNDLVI